MIGATIMGQQAVSASLAGLPDAVRQRLRDTVARLGLDLAARVQEALSGPVLAARSGRLRASIAAEIAEAPDRIELSIGSDAPYAAIHEWGGITPAHDIRAVKARALAFSIGGRPVFARSVHHPGSRIPERSFLRRTLEEAGDDVRAALAEAVAEAVPR